MKVNTVTTSNPMKILVIVDPVTHQVITVRVDIDRVRVDIDRVRVDIDRVRVDMDRVLADRVGVDIDTVKVGVDTDRAKVKVNMDRVGADRARVGADRVDTARVDRVGADRVGADRVITVIQDQVSKAKQVAIRVNAATMSTLDRSTSQVLRARWIASEPLSTTHLLQTICQTIISTTMALHPTQHNRNLNLSPEHHHRRHYHLVHPCSILKEKWGMDHVSVPIN